MRKIAKNYKLPYYTMSPTYSICKDHGYLSGEQHVCPICGAETEVYSRITGYYRPVKNWNDGKAQEYKERKNYDINRSRQLPDPLILPNTETPVYTLEAAEAAMAQAVAAAATEAAATCEEQILLFTTKTCPNCRIAGAILNQAGVAFDKVDAEEHVDLVNAYGVRQAPTLIVVKGNEFQKYNNASEIKKFAETR